MRAAIPAVLLSVAVALVFHIFISRAYYLEIQAKALEPGKRANWADDSEIASADIDP